MKKQNYLIACKYEILRVIQLTYQRVLEANENFFILEKTKVFV